MSMQSFPLYVHDKPNLLVVLLWLKEPPKNRVRYEKRQFPYPLAFCIYTKGRAAKVCYILLWKYPTNST